jgi:hypothetical protein
MKAASFKALCLALDREGVRFLVAGGLAVNAHGFLRFTKDVDLCIDLVAENIAGAFKALSGLGYRPNVAVTAEQFMDEGTRRRWITEKGMTVLQFWSDEHAQTPVDVFVALTFDFEAEYAKAVVKEGAETTVRFVSYETLIAMKELAGREQDAVDIAQLRMLRES